LYFTSCFDTYHTLTEHFHGIVNVEAPTFSWTIGSQTVVNLSSSLAGCLLPQKDSWCSFLLEVKSTPGLEYGWKVLGKFEKSNAFVKNRTRDLPHFSASTKYSEAYSLCWSWFVDLTGLESSSNLWYVVCYMLWYKSVIVWGGGRVPSYLQGRRIIWKNTEGEKTKRYICCLFAWFTFRPWRFKQFFPLKSH
jgi:hypothetical protein